MGRAVKFLGLSLFFFAVPAVAATDFKKPPKIFCEPALSVAERTRSCEGNGILLNAAKDCLTKLNDLEKSLGVEAQAIAQAAQASQLGKIKGGTAEYTYSAEALVYLRAIALAAARQVADYKDYVVLPPDAERESSDNPSDPYGWAWGVDCYGGSKKALDRARQDFTDKIARYDTRLAQARQFEGKLVNSGSDFSSLSSAKLKSGGVSAGDLSGVSKPTRESDVSGVIHKDEHPVKK